MEDTTSDGDQSMLKDISAIHHNHHNQTNDMMGQNNNSSMLGGQGGGLYHDTTVNSSSEYCYGRRGIPTFGEREERHMSFSNLEGATAHEGVE